MMKRTPRRIATARRGAIWAVIGIAALATASSTTITTTMAMAKAEPAPMVVKLRSPRPSQVVQREGYDPARAFEHHRGGPELGWGMITILGEFPGEAKTFEARDSPLSGALGQGSQWRELKAKGGTETDAGRLPWRAEIRIPAGGWRRLEIQAKDQNQRVIATSSVEPIGAGEVFLIAGQSYASNSNDERLRIEDPERRVVAFDSKADRWVAADDPQPTPDGSDGGSIWPAFGNLLLPVVQTPIGWANAAVGGTSSRQWLPGGPLHRRMIEDGRKLGKFRAVLWQQGESDVIEKTATDAYVRNLRAIRSEAAKAWGFDPPWLLAKSTLHPTVYRDPDGEARIRTAIDELCREPGFRRGPDTDLLGGPHRGGLGTRRHFTGAGQRAAASLWFASVWNDWHALSLPARP